MACYTCQTRPHDHLPFVGAMLVTAGIETSGSDTSSCNGQMLLLSYYIKAEEQDFLGHEAWTPQASCTSPLNFDIMAFSLVQVLSAVAALPVARACLGYATGDEIVPTGTVSSSKVISVAAVRYVPAPESTRWFPEPLTVSPIPISSDEC